MRGRSQQERTSRGEERGSDARQRLGVNHPVSEDALNHIKLARAITKLCIREEGQSHFGDESQAVGRSIIVGIKIFNIRVN